MQMASPIVLKSCMLIYRERVCYLSKLSAQLSYLRLKMQCTILYMNKLWELCTYTYKTTVNWYCCLIVGYTSACFKIIHSLSGYCSWTYDKCNCKTIFYNNFHSCTVQLDTTESFIYPTDAQLYCSKNVKIYIKIYMRGAATCFGFSKPSSGSYCMCFAKIISINNQLKYVVYRIILTDY